MPDVVSAMELIESIWFDVTPPPRAALNYVEFTTKAKFRRVHSFDVHAAAIGRSGYSCSLFASATLLAGNGRVESCNAIGPRGRALAARLPRDCMMHRACAAQHVATPCKRRSFGCERRSDGRTDRGY